MVSLSIRYVFSTRLKAQHPEQDDGAQRPFRKGDVDTVSVHVKGRSQKEHHAHNGYRQVGRARDDGIGSREAQREGYPAIHAAPQHGSLGAHVEI